MARIPEAYRDLFSKDNPLMMYLATIMPDGTPQVTPVWFDHDGTYILINTARGRVKDRNMAARPYVACLVMDPKNDGRFVQIRGPVVEATEEGAEEHGRMLAQRYTGSPERDYRFETRVIFRIRPDHITAMG